MNHITFTLKEQKLLEKNPHVETVSSKGITYTDEFKRLFIVEYEKGFLPRAIFEQFGFDIAIIGESRIRNASRRWRMTFRENGLDGLKDNRKGSSGRPRERELTIEENFKQLVAQNALLRAENELLKKLEMAERKVIKEKSD